jgi:cell division septation protein DedD
MNKKNPDNLEFNDGLGDLLREKEDRQFSLRRTVTVLLLFVLVVFLVLFVTVKLGTRFLFTPTDTESTVQTAKIDNDALVRELAEMERLMSEKKAVNPEAATKVTAPVVSKSVKKETVVRKASVVSAKKEARVTSKKRSVPHKVIVGTFSDEKNALVLKTELKKQGIDAFVWDRHVDNRDWHAVQAGAFATQEAAQRFAALLRKKGYPAYVLYK